MTADTHYDVIIIGTGAGGGTLARELAPTGKRILILERGDFLPREKENWEPVAVYQNSRYYTKDEKRIGKSGEPFDLQTCYWVGGNTKVYGAALLRSANEQYPNGLANRSNQVGRNLMKHLATTMVSLNTQKNGAVHRKTIAVSNFYWGEPAFPYPMGLVQSTGNVKGGMLPGQAPDLLAPYLKATPAPVLDEVASYATGWWLQTEDLPEPDNRVQVKDLHITERNTAEHSERSLVTSA